MGTHSSSRTHRGAIIDPLLVGFLVVGLAFVGIALASQRRAPSIAASDRITSSPPVSNLWAAAPEDEINDASDGVVPTVVPVAARGPANVLPKVAPVFLDVEAIGVHSRLHDLGLDPSGAIEAPSGARYDEAAWYRHSPMPGSLGPSIILGHVDSASNGPSVFFRLGELVRGDRISVTRADGSIARFTVQTIARYPKEDFPTERVYGDLDHAGLRLITCGGAFNDASGHYEDNVVVFARLDAPFP